MITKKKVCFFIGLVAGLAAWYWFRPDLLLIDSRVSEPLPGLEIREPNGNELAHGEFVGVAHETKGRAAVHQVTTDRRILRLTDFATSNGPDVRVYLVAVDEARDSETVARAEFVDLGTLKGNIGDQNYELPASLDLAKYRTAVIWCKRFGVNFAAAPLKTLER